jgi:signal transduction histidine kinase
MSLNVEDFSVFLRLGTIRRVIAALVILMLGLVVTVFLASMYTRPIEQIAAAAGKVAAGDLSQQLPVRRQDEIGVLSRSFNHMVARLRQDRDLRERLRTAEHLAGMGQFAKSVAHEIKNPLNFISLSIDHLSEAYRPEDADKAARLESMVRNIKGEIQRISRFVESYLELGKPFELHRRPTPMGEVVDGVLALVEARAEQGGIRIVREYDELPELAVDPELIRTCLYNIVINAFDAMPEGGALTVRAEHSSTRFSLAFADSGVGIAQEQIDKVFEPYFTTKDKGFGLGLALTRKIVEEHGGKVLFSSRPGAGSVVTLQLPPAMEGRG